MNLAGIYQQLKHDLNDVERELERTIASHEPTLHQAGLTLLKAGGKRIRPILVLLSSQFGNENKNNVRKVAVALELIHMASLVHDDVIDDAELRRGKRTVKSQWDNRVAMYTGDFIFARALHQITQIEIPVIHEILSHAIKEMNLGEIAQIRDQYNWHQNLRNYLLRIKRKTALLMAVCCQLGALSAGASLSLSKKLYYFGYFSGMAFQITDDILDFVGTEKELGKPAGGDIKQGNLTLPAMLAFEDPVLKQEFFEFSPGPDLGDAYWPKVVEQIRTSDGIEKAQDISNRYLNKAYQILEHLPKNKAVRSMEEIARYIGKRKY